VIGVGDSITNIVSGLLIPVGLSAFATFPPPTAGLILKHFDFMPSTGQILVMYNDIAETRFALFPTGPGAQIPDEEFVIEPNVFMEGGFATLNTQNAFFVSNLVSDTFLFDIDEKYSIWKNI